MAASQSHTGLCLLLIPSGRASKTTGRPPRSWTDPMTWSMRDSRGQVARWARRSLLAGVAVLVTTLTPWAVPGWLGATRAADLSGIPKHQLVWILRQEKRTCHRSLRKTPGAD